MIPGDERHVGLLGRRAGSHGARRKRTGRCQHAPRVDVLHADRHRHAIDVIERHRVLVETGGVQPRERVERVHGARRLAIVFRFDVEIDFREAIRARHGAAHQRRRRVDARQLAHHVRRPIGVLLLERDLDLRPRRGVAGVVHAHLARPSVSCGMDDREDLSRRREPPPRRRAAERVEEVERHEVEILVQRLERRHELFVDADAEVGLAHPDFDVEVAVKRLLLRQRPVVGDLHHVVVDARQHD